MKGIGRGFGGNCIHVLISARFCGFGSNLSLTPESFSISISDMLFGILSLRNSKSKKEMKSNPFPSMRYFAFAKFPFGHKVLFLNIWEHILSAGTQKGMGNLFSFPIHYCVWICFWEERKKIFHGNQIPTPLRIWIPLLHMVLWFSPIFIPKVWKKICDFAHDVESLTFLSNIAMFCCANGS